MSNKDGRGFPRFFSRKGAKAPRAQREEERERKLEEQRKFLALLIVACSLIIIKSPINSKYLPI
jgi:hypothetical protein